MLFGEKNPDEQKELPFKSDPSWYSKARRKGNMQIKIQRWDRSKLIEIQRGAR